MIKRIVQTVAKKFRVFGGPIEGSVHPIDKHLDGKPVVFALGVDVAEVVRVVLEESGFVDLLRTARRVEQLLGEQKFVNQPIQQAYGELRSIVNVFKDVK